MKKNSGYLQRILIFCLTFTFVCVSLPSFSQENLTTPTEPIQVSTIEFQKTRQQLFQITKKKLKIRSELEQFKKSPQTKEATERIEELRGELEELNRNFEVLASQIHENELPKKDDAQINWLDELQELTMPLLQVIHEISEKPRKIDKLKTKIETLQLQISRYEEARNNLNGLLKLEIDTPIDQKVMRSYEKQLAKLESKYNPELIQLRLDEAKRSLLKVQTTQKSIFDIVKDSAGKFFKERGRNLLIASITFLGLWWILLRTYRALNHRPFILNKLNPQLRRLIKTAASIVIIIVCTIASLISLYLLDDWLLLSIAILFIMTVAWVSRQLIPNFVKELRIIMNLGAAREGERIIWKGVPFLVKEIGLYVTLTNDRLDGGIIRMPVGELIGMHSRPVVDLEEWFPTNKKDWVILDDGTYGRVESQTMEQVILYNYASLKYYPTLDFINQKPRNLSKGYRLVIKFGLDYGVQSRICDEIPNIFEEGLKKYLQKYYDKEPPEITSLHVHFDEAGSSSLNLIVLVTVDGKYADDYYPLKWKVSKTLVQICNDNDLVIPFSQLTVSLSGDVKKFTSQKDFSNQDLSK